MPVMQKRTRETKNDVSSRRMTTGAGIWTSGLPDEYDKRQHGGKFRLMGAFVGWSTGFSGDPSAEDRQ